MSNSIKTRFKDAVWAKNSHNVSIGGVGGIGSWLSLLLARTEQNITAWDDDVIDDSNMSGQLYPMDQIGSHKVTTCEQIAYQFAGYGFTYAALPTKLNEESVVDAICFSAFDNMEARKAMFTAWEKLHANSKNAIFIDGRMLMEVGQIFCVTHSNAKEYREKYLFADSEAPLVDCSTKATSHCGAFISSLMVSFFTNHLSNIEYEDVIRDVPFRFEFELPIANFTTYDK